jgi:hypothetical protein
MAKTVGYPCAIATKMVNVLSSRIINIFDKFRFWMEKFRGQEWFCLSARISTSLC